MTLDREVYHWSSYSYVRIRQVAPSKFYFEQRTMLSFNQSQMMQKSHPKHDFLELQSNEWNISIYEKILVTSKDISW